MKSYFFGLLTLFISACNKPPILKEFPLLVHVPEQASFIIRTENFSLLKNNLKNNSAFQNFISKASFKNSEVLYQSLLNISSVDPAIISLREIGKNQIDFLFVSQKDAVTLKNTFFRATSAYESNTIVSYALENGLSNSADKEFLLYSTQINQEVLYSSSKLMIENAIRSWDIKKYSKELLALFRVSKEEALYFSLDQNSWLATNNFIPFSEKHFGKWGVLNTSYENKKIDFHGFNSQNDSLPYFLNLFKDSSPSYLKSPEYIPDSADKMWAYNLSNYEDFEIQQRKYLNRSEPMDTLFKQAVEVSQFRLNKNYIGIIHLSDTQNTEAFLMKQKRAVVTYQGTSIYQMNTGEIISDIFSPLIDKVQANFGCLIDQSFVVGSSLSDIQTVIGNMNTKTTLANNHAYIKSKETLAENSSLLFYESHKSPFKASEPYQFLLSSSSKKDHLEVFASQWVADQGFFHQHLSILEIAPSLKETSVTPLFTFNLEAPLGKTLQWVENHQNKEQDILVQDQKHLLYLIDNKGKLLWKKQLNSPIQGKVVQVDIYKNGRLQLAFTTEDQWLIIDRNGAEVKPFKQNFKGASLGALSVFDYDSKREYRFVFSQGKNIYMYDNRGEKVKGFTFSKTNSELIEAPKHFKIKGADFIVLREINGQIDLLGRTGETRIKNTKKYAFSDNEIMLYEGTFAFTDLNGNLIQIDPDGKEKTKTLRVNATHKTTHYKNQLVVLEDNILFSKGEKAVLDFGVYTLPKIFDFNKKIYISITDIQNNKVYLFNENLTPIHKFPVFGSEAIDLVDMDLDGNLEILTKDNEDSLIVYKISN